MAIVVNPTVFRSNSGANTIGPQILAEAVATAKQNERNDINQAFLNADAELKEAIASGRLQQMLQYDDTTPAAMNMVRTYIQTRAAREGRKVNDKDIDLATQEFIQKFSQNGLLTPELVQLMYRNYREPSEGSPAPGPGPDQSTKTPTPAPNQTPPLPDSTSGNVPATGGVQLGNSVTPQGTSAGIPVAAPVSVGRLEGGAQVAAAASDPEAAGYRGAMGASNQDALRIAEEAEIRKMGFYFAPDGTLMADPSYMPGTDSNVRREVASRAIARILADPNTDPVSKSAALRLKTALETGKDVSKVPPAPYKPPVEEVNPTPVTPPQEPGETFREWLVRQQDEGANFTRRPGYQKVGLTGKLTDEELMARNKDLIPLWKSGAKVPKGPPKTIQSNEDISRKTQEIALGLSSTGDEIPVRIPKIAQETAKEVDKKAPFYKKWKESPSLLDKLKAKKLESQAEKVWKTTKMSPEFKRVTQEEYKYWKDWAKKATAEDLAMAGMPEVAKIKNDAERVRVTERLGAAELEYNQLKTAAALGSSTADIVKAKIDANIEIVKGLLTATKGDKNALEKLLTNEAFNSAVNAIGFLNGLTPEQMYTYVPKLFGGVKAVPLDPATWNNPFPELRQQLQPATTGTSAAEKYIQEKQKE